MKLKSSLENLIVVFVFWGPWEKQMSSFVRNNYVASSAEMDERTVFVWKKPMWNILEGSFYSYIQRFKLSLRENMR